MGTIAKPNTFSANTVMASSAVNADFDTIYNEFNGNINASNLADDAVTAAKIADSAVTPAALMTGAGTDWATQTYTPTFATWTLGNGTFEVRGTKIGKFAFIQLIYIAGSTSAWSSGARFTLAEVDHKFYPNNQLNMVGSGYFTDSSTGDIWPIICRLKNGGSSQGYSAYVLSSGKYVTLTSTVPVTVAEGDTFTMMLCVEIN